jgi:2-oxoglutarate/2-oxoacid ferredoxin oxidoreductase subunit beta
MEPISHPVYDYLRQNKKFPNVWCSGCGIGLVMGALIRAIDRMGLDKDEISLVSGIGCSGRLPTYVDFNTLHTTHGRALAFATGLKLAKPDQKVIVVMGDGDALAIGGNHFIHSARRNIDLTAIVIDNQSYGLTGGQYSPTTPQGTFATTAVYGNIEQSFDIGKLAEAAGATFVARGTVFHARELDGLIEKGLRKVGFALVEVMSYCHTSYGKLNKRPVAVEWQQWLRDNTVPVTASAKMKPEQLAGKILRGILVDREAPEYVAEYEKIIQRAQAQGAGR